MKPVFFLRTTWKKKDRRPPVIYDGSTILLPPKEISQPVYPDVFYRDEYKVDGDRGAPQAHAQQIFLHDSILRAGADPMHGSQRPSFHNQQRITHHRAQGTLLDEDFLKEDQHNGVSNSESIPPRRPLRPPGFDLYAPEICSSTQTSTDTSSRPSSSRSLPSRPSSARRAGRDAFEPFGKKGSLNNSEETKGPRTGRDYNQSNVTEKTRVYLETEAFYSDPHSWANPKTTQHLHGAPLGSPSLSKNSRDLTSSTRPPSTLPSSTAPSTPQFIYSSTSPPRPRRPSYRNIPPNHSPPRSPLPSLPTICRDQTSIPTARPLRSVKSDCCLLYKPDHRAAVQTKAVPRNLDSMPYPWECNRKLEPSSSPIGLIRPPISTNTTLDTSNVEVTDTHQERNTRRIPSPESRGHWIYAI